jgi:hypothetical protein
LFSKAVRMARRVRLLPCEQERAMKATGNSDVHTSKRMIFTKLFAIPMPQRNTD